MPFATLVLLLLFNRRKCFPAQGTMLHSRCRWLDRRDTCLGDWVRWVVLFLFGGDGVVQTYVSAEALLAVQRDGHVGRFSLVEINKSAAFKLAGFEIRQPPYLLYLTAAFEEVSS